MLSGVALAFLAPTKPIVTNSHVQLINPRVETALRRFAAGERLVPSIDAMTVNHMAHRWLGSQSQHASPTGRR